MGIEEGEGGMTGRVMMREKKRNLNLLWTVEGACKDDDDEGRMRQ